MLVMGDCTLPLGAKLCAEISKWSFSYVLGSREDAVQKQRWRVISAPLGRGGRVHFGTRYRRSLTEAGNKLLFIDYYGHAEYHPSDLVLNQYAHAREGLYRARGRNTKLLLGPHYALLRRDSGPGKNGGARFSRQAAKYF